MAEAPTGGGAPHLQEQEQVSMPVPSNLEKVHLHAKLLRLCSVVSPEAADSFCLTVCAVNQNNLVCYSCGSAVPPEQEHIEACAVGFVGEFESALMVLLVPDAFLNMSHQLHFRQLAWPFRAWAALLDDRQRAAQSRPAAAAASPATALAQRYREQKGRHLLHDSFWHWQVATSLSSCQCFASDTRTPVPSADHHTQCNASSRLSIRQSRAL